MSNYETHVGKIKLFPRENEELDKEYLKRALENFKEEIWDRVDSIEQYIEEDDIYEEVFYVNDKLYLNVEHKALDEDDCELEGDDENGYRYYFNFYNGGTCLTEMIEESLKRKSK